MEKRRRLSDQETAERMIRAATEMIQESGLTVSLEHLSVEDVIRRADVSRATAYRRWKYKSEFFADLLRALARDPHPALVIGTRARDQQLAAAFAANLDWVATPGGRDRLYGEAIRIGGSVDLRMLATSNLWRSYVALQAAVLSLEEGSFRIELTEALAASERQTHDRLAGNYARLATLFGLRLRRDARIGFEDLAIMCSSLMNGVAIKAQSDRSLLTRTAAGSEAPSAEPWTLASLGCYAIQTYYLEPDPAVTWDDDRITQVKNLLRQAARSAAPGELQVTPMES